MVLIYDDVHGNQTSQGKETACLEERQQSADQSTQLARVHEGEDMVNCILDGEVLPNLTRQTEYNYRTEPPNLKREIHILRVQQALINYFHGLGKCQKLDGRIDNLVLGVPHRVTGRLGMEEGYGIYARQGWALYKLAIFALVTQAWVPVFVICWLWKHPGDLQNAFSPAYYWLAFITLFVTVPDILSTARKRDPVLSVCVHCIEQQHYQAP